MDLIWKKFLDKQEKELGKEIVDQWLRTLKIVHFDACNLYLQAKDSFQLSWFEEHMRPKINSLFNNNYRRIKIHLSLDSSSISKEPKIVKKLKNLPSNSTFKIQPDWIDPKSTFDNFIPGSVNQLVHNFFLNLTATTYNPVFIYGSAGVGKTHLLMALANHLISKGINVFYVHAETFTEHVVSAIRNFQMAEFRKIYRSQKVLIIDDIHILSRKTATQEEFFHTFNALHSLNRLIILSGKVVPSKMQEIEPRLISRFEWGIIFQLQKLPQEELKQVIKKRALALNFPLSDEIIDFLVTSFSKSMSCLMRAFEALILRASEDSFSISKNKAENLLQDLIDEEKKSTLTLEKIVALLAQHFGIPIKDIIGKSQVHECVLPRQIAMYLIREHLKLSYPAIGKFFYRDHSTVMTSIKQIQEKVLAKDGAVLQAVAIFENNPHIRS